MRCFRALVFVTLCLLSGCLNAPAQDGALQPGAKYVALGSSFGSGPGVGERADGSSPWCAQSASNYAHLLAAKRRLQLVDVTCGGATTANILTTPQRSSPPQIEAVDAQTRLVTITAGGNDVFYLGNLSGESCVLAPDKVPEASRTGVCRVIPNAEVQRGFEEVPRRLRAVVEAVKEKAPRATIVLVSYIDILPQQGSCSERAPLTDDELRDNRQVAAKLTEITAQVAEQEHVKLLDVSKLATGHDVCAADPWIFPFGFTPGLAFAPAAYHPTLKAMQAIATALDRMLP